jgi:hypothetical protein
VQRRSPGISILFTSAVAATEQVQHRLPRHQCQLHVSTFITSRCVILRCVLALPRCSANVDLNRNFPDRFDDMAVSGKEEPETVAIMDWTLKTGFVAGASMHEVRSLAGMPAGVPTTGSSFAACWKITALKSYGF